MNKLCFFLFLCVWIKVSRFVRLRRALAVTVDVGVHSHERGCVVPQSLVLFHEKARVTGVLKEGQRPKLLRQ